VLDVVSNSPSDPAGSWSACPSRPGDFVSAETSADGEAAETVPLNRLYFL